MFTYFTANNTNRYLEILPKLLHAYNNSHHRSIGMKPVEVTNKNSSKVWHRLYGDMAGIIQSKRTKQYPIRDDIVRISKAKTQFEKGYLPNWSTELFKIEGFDESRPKRLYKLKDYVGEEIAGRFYPEEIQEVKDSGVYKIEKVLNRRKGKGGHSELFVKWKGWPKKFNSWIQVKDLEK
jgi:hypothetical protein